MFKMKRFIAFLLTVVMVFSCLPVSLATDGENQVARQERQAPEQIDALADQRCRAQDQKSQTQRNSDERQDMLIEPDIVLCKQPVPYKTAERRAPDKA